MEIRRAESADLPALLALYTQLHDTPMPAIDARVEGVWAQMLSDQNHHVLLGIADGHIVSSCVLVIVPNLTHGQRPYALIENVVTDEKHRRRGYASAVLDFAKTVAQQNRCYKIMLMTGSRLESTLGFYERAGFNRRDKTGFILWLA